MYADTLHILKIGGKVIEDPALLSGVLDAFVAFNGPRLLVHGGGKYADLLSRKLGIEPRMHQGRRITGAADLEVAVMVYAGQANKTLVSALQARGCNALGLSGADGNAILAHRRPVREVDYGFVGDIDTVNDGLIRQLLGAGLTPVFCAVTHDGHGQLLNTNADTIASRLATALAPHYAVTLHFCFERPGVLLDASDDTSVIQLLNQEEFHRLRQAGVITAGMLPKLDNAFDALSQGVREVVICGVESLGAGGGTRITR